MRLLHIEPWRREFKKLGHEPNLISPQPITPHVANHKNDYKDTEAIIEDTRLGLGRPWPNKLGFDSTQNEIAMLGQGPTYDLKW